MHIVILAPSDRSFIIKFFPDLDEEKLPVGYSGAPFIGTVISELLEKSHQVTAITTSVAINNDYEVKRFTRGNFSWIVVPARPRSFRRNGKKRGRMLDFFAYEVKQMSKEVQAIQPDFIHAHWSYEFAGAALKSVFPSLVTVHDNAFKVLIYFRNAYRFGRMLMGELNLKKVRFASSVSPYMETYVKRNIKELRIIPYRRQINRSYY
jgi:hypothetical protein